MRVRYGVRRVRNRLTIPKKDTDMTKEEKELLTKVLCEQLPYGVQVEIECYHNGILKGIEGDTISTDRGTNYPLRLVKPYLCPLPSMTESEAIDIVKLIKRLPRKHILEIKVEEDGIEATVDDGICMGVKYFIFFFEIVKSIAVFDYLNAKHFDIRGLIPMGLAIAAVGKDNPYKEKGGEE